MIKDLVKKELLNPIIETLGRQFSDFEVEGIQNQSFGDFALNVALKASKILNQSALEIANRIKARIESQNRIFEKIEVAVPGFVNLTLKKEYLLAEIGRILENGENYGSANNLKGKKIAIEYTDPNPFKEFHIGHLYSNIVGESLAKLKEAIGGHVWRCDYFGDVGMHVAKYLWGLLKKFDEDKITIVALEKWELNKRIEYFGQAYSLGATEYEGNSQAQTEIKQLNVLIFKAAQLVVLPQFNETEKINYDQYIGVSKYDFEEIKKLYAIGRKWSLEYFETIYQRLGTKFDGYYPESRTGEYGYGMVLEGLGKGVFEKGENGAIIFPGSKYGLHNRVFINALGLPTYETKDFGNAAAKNVDFPYDESVIVTGNEINEYFHVVLKALRMLYPELGEKTVHIGHGMVRLPEGKMSSRTGKVIRGEWLLDETKKRANKIVRESRNKLKEALYEKRISGEKSKYFSRGKIYLLDQEEVNEISEVVALAAVKYVLLKTSLGKNTEFSFSESVSFEGNSGPYLQYTYARARSVLRKSETVRGSNPIAQGTGTRELDPLFQNPNDQNVSNFDIRDSILSKEELSLLRTLYKFPEVVETAALNYQPHLICNFLFDLAQKFNSFYNNVPILMKNSDSSENSGDQNGRKFRKSKGQSSDSSNLSGESGLLSRSEFSEETSSFRLALTGACAQVLRNGLYLLGIHAPERM